MVEQGSQHLVRIGIIGAGIMGTDHAQLLSSQVQGAQVAGISDTDERRATELAAAVNARVFTDGAALISDPEVDAVIIASADHTHYEYTMAALAAQKPVLTEKPLAPTVTECRDLVHADSGLISVGFMRRFDPACAQLRALVRDETHGLPLLVHCVSRGVSSGPGSTTESAISNSAIHELDFVPWLLDSPIATVSWQAPRSSRNADGFADPQLLTLESESGVIATCELFLNARYGHDVRAEVVFEEAAAAMAEPALVTTHNSGRRSVTYGPDWRRRWAEAYRIELQAWVDHLRRRAAGTQEGSSSEATSSTQATSSAPAPADPASLARTQRLATASDGLAAALVVEALIESQRSGGARTHVRSVAEVLGRPGPASPDTARSSNPQPTESDPR